MKKILYITPLILLMAGCATQPTLTKEESVAQSMSVSKNEQKVAEIYQVIEMEAKDIKQKQLIMKESNDLSALRSVEIKTRVLLELVQEYNEEAKKVSDAFLKSRRLQRSYSIEELLK